VSSLLASFSKPIGEGQDLWLSHSMGFEKEARRGDVSSMHSANTGCNE
jgi:hypothetical protein